MTRPLAILFPVAVALGSSHALYLHNQRELQHTVSVLYPFWVAAFLCAGLGLLLQRVDHRPPARTLLWAYYAAGWAFLAWGLLREATIGTSLPLWVLDTAWGAIGFAALYVAAVALGQRTASPRRLEPLLAAIAAVLIVAEGTGFARRLETAPPASLRNVAAEVPAPSPGGPANVYHIVLDAFPDDVFDAALSPEARAAFDGFVRFPATQAHAVATRASLPGVFTGNSTPSGDPAALERALAGADSLFGILKRAGYLRVAVLPRSVYPAPAPAFDHVLFHDENARVHDAAQLHAAVFRRLWLFRNAPLAFTQTLAHGAMDLDAESLRSFQGQRLSTYTQPVESRLSLERLLETEERLPGRGRYTLVHALLPHSPYLLRADCSAGSDRDRTDVRQQSACALRLVAELLQRLRQLDRYETATILVHGDHGAEETWSGGRLVHDPSAVWRTLLMIKPPGARGPLRVSRERARLLDVTPTLAGALGLAPGYAMEGRELPFAALPASPSS